MTTYEQFNIDLTRLCDRLRVAGVPETTIKDFAERWSEQASGVELNETADRLELLEKLVHSGKEQTTAAFDEYMKLTEGIEELTERPELPVLSAGEPAQEVPPKHPHIKVKLSDLDSQMWPILRRVSYAMSDAGVDEAEIEQYKNDVRNTDDPIGVTRRWIQVA